MPARRLWLCLYFPRLSLGTGADAGGKLRAVLGEAGRNPVILLCNEAARRRGVRPGMSLGTALSLAPDLDAQPRDLASEQRELRRLALEAERFTPAVSPDACGALMLEIAGSAHLFGGVSELRAAVCEVMRRRGHVVVPAVAPTARAALWLAKAGREVVLGDSSLLPGMLGQLPLPDDWPDSVRVALRSVGARQLGDCLRLPRDGFARRFGPTCLHEIDEALGRRAEVRRMAHADARFCSVIELPAESSDHAVLTAALHQILPRLAKRLQVLQLAAWIVRLRLRHAAATTPLRLGLLQPSADVRHIGDLLALRLSGTRLPAPVRAIDLEAALVPLHAAAGSDLFGAREDPALSLTALVERLRARLGTDAVHGVEGCDEHRPERAWQRVRELGIRRAAAGGAVPAPAVSRPLWLLDPPALLPLHSGKPSFHGLLVFESGPERIETGWWDGGDVRREYHVARNARGMRLWVYRDCRGGWYLHGLFG